LLAIDYLGGTKNNMDDDETADARKEGVAYMYILLGDYPSPPPVLLFYLLLLLFSSSCLPHVLLFLFLLFLMSSSCPS
jgi:hypothetical protein